MLDGASAPELVLHTAHVICVGVSKVRKESVTPLMKARSDDGRLFTARPEQHLVGGGRWPGCGQRRRAGLADGRLILPGASSDR